jgi:hypothetical protein
VPLRAPQEFYVKWKGRAHIHCQWVPRAALEADPNVRRRVKRFIEAMAVEDLDEEEPAPEAAEGGSGAGGGTAAEHEFTRVERVLAEAAQGEGLPPA